MSRAPRIVALGGGHGLFASLSALRRLTTELTAVVTVADDGGSSGRIRRELGVLPPGDLRMALVALAAEPDGAGPGWHPGGQNCCSIVLAGRARWPAIRSATCC